MKTPSRLVPAIVLATAVYCSGAVRGQETTRVPPIENIPIEATPVQQKDAVELRVAVVLNSGPTTLAFTLTNASKQVVVTTPVTTTRSTLVVINPNGHESRIAEPVHLRAGTLVEPSQSVTWQVNMETMEVAGGVPGLGARPEIASLFKAPGVYRVFWETNGSRSNDIYLLKKATDGATGVRTPPSPMIFDGMVLSMEGHAKEDAALPDANSIRDITLEKGTAGKTLTAAEFKQLMKTAEPMSEEEFTKHAIPVGYWYQGSFNTPNGVYRFTLGLGGVNYLVAPSGSSLRFKFNRDATAAEKELILK